MIRYVQEPQATPDGPRQLLFGRVGMAITMAQAAHSTYKAMKKWHDEKRQYTVAVRSDDNVYDAVHTWLRSQFEESRSTVIRTSTRYDNESSGYDTAMPDDGSDHERVASVMLMHNETSEREFK